MGKQPPEIFSSDRSGRFVSPGVAPKAKTRGTLVISLNQAREGWRNNVFLIICRPHSLDDLNNMMLAHKEIFP